MGTPQLAVGHVDFRTVGATLQGLAGDLPLAWCRRVRHAVLAAGLLEPQVAARRKLRVGRNEPKVWFTSTESFAKVLSAGNRDLLRVIAEQEPGSLDELARITVKAKSNLSRTLKTMAGYGLGYNV